jgi:Uma2 family endonuclease
MSLVLDTDVMSDDSLPDWLIPPDGGFTADEFLQLRGLPKHTQLIDGSLVFVSPQQIWHRKVISLLEQELERQAPAEFRADREMALRLAPRQAPEPDVLVVTAEAQDRDGSATYYEPNDVALAVEVVSPDSEERDRETKPLKYAKAGIKHFWRVEKDGGGRVVVYVYELDPVTRVYAISGIQRERLMLGVPFGIDIDLTPVDKWFNG